MPFRAQMFAGVGLVVACVLRICCGGHWEVWGIVSMFAHQAVCVHAAEKAQFCSCRAASKNLATNVFG